MTYFGFLALFLGIPIAVMVWLTRRDRQNGRSLPPAFITHSPYVVLAAHILLALIYTTPWDNYLVATNVWWYDPELVTGIVIGWVPIEEYTFFIVQPIMTGLWLLFWMRREKINTEGQRDKATEKNQENLRPVPSKQLKFRIAATATVGVIWLAMLILMISGWDPATYLTLQLVWALPPIMLQLGMGADILWKHRRLVAIALLPTTAYLAVADAIAIQSGTWTIDPAQSLHWLIGGVLPFEELLFFFITNTLVVFGMTLVLAEETQPRGQWILAILRRLRPRLNQSSESSTPPEPLS